MALSLRFIESTVNKKFLLLVQNVAIFLIFVNANLANVIPPPHSHLENQSYTNGTNTTVRFRRSNTGNRILYDLATEFKSMMNESVEPCDNFEEFVCGNAPAGYSRADQIAEKTARELRSVFEGPRKTGELKPLTYAKNFYKACVNSEPSQESDWSTLKEILRMFGGWPVVEGDSWSEENRSWRKLHINLLKMGFEGLMKVNNTLKYQGNSGPGMLENLVTIAVKMGARRENATTEIQQALKLNEELDTKFASIENLNFHYMYELLKMLGKMRKMQPPRWELHAFSDLELSQKAGLINFLDNISKRKIFNYALIQVVANLTSFSTDLSKRRENCADFISDRWPEIQEILYARKYLQENTKNVIDQLAQDLKPSLKNEYQRTFGLRAYQSLPVESFIDGLEYRLGYPDEFFNDNEIKDYYVDFIEIHETDFLQGFLNYTRYTLNHSAPHDIFNFRNSLQKYISPNNGKVISTWNGAYVSTGYLRTLFNESLPKFVIYADLIANLAIQSSDTLPYEHLKDRKRIGHNWETVATYWLYVRNIDGEEFSLPGLDKYTYEQMFWISLAHFQCNHFTESVTKLLDFRRDFKCELRS